MTTVSELIEWCEAEGLDAAPAIGHAMWSAIRRWSKGAPRETRSALCAMSAATVARLKGKASGPLRSRQVSLASQAQSRWAACGMPLLDQVSANTQRAILALRKSSAHRRGEREAVHA